MDKKIYIATHSLSEHQRSELLTLSETENVEIVEIENPIHRDLSQIVEDHKQANYLFESIKQFNFPFQEPKSRNQVWAKKNKRSKF